MGNVSTSKSIDDWFERLYKPKKFNNNFTEVKAESVNLPATSPRYENNYLKSILDKAPEGDDKTVIVNRVKDVVLGGLEGAIGGAIGAMMPIPTLIALESINWYSNHKTRKECEKELEALRGLAESNYQIYIEFHDGMINDAVSAIDNINRKKTVAKECFLLDLYDELKVMGMNVQYSDFKSEFIDLRDFNVNEKYKKIQEKSEERNNFMNSIIKNLSDLIRSPKKLKSKVEAAKRILLDNEAMMMSDLIKLECFSLALMNIAEIYTCVIDEIKPMMKKHLRDMAILYDHNMEAIPNDKKVNLYNIKSILQSIAEEEILGGLEKSVSVEQVIQTNNALSDNYERIKKEIRIFM